MSRWLNSKARLYSTGGYLQHPAMNHEEEEPEKERHARITTVVLHSRN